MTRQWTFMVYMAGDNGKVFDDNMQLMDNLVGYGWQNIADMSSVGSTDDVAIVVQYDTLDASEVPRLFIDGSSSIGTIVTTLPSVNTGDSKNLTDFVVWAMDQYPAEKVALILWNHGTGWKEDDIYARYRHAEQISRRDEQHRAAGLRKRLGQAFFMSTAAQLMSIEDDEVRGICYDDTSMDFLDNQDLVQALVEAEDQTGKHIDLLGMDACLMSMIEVAYQVRKQATCLVASQEVVRATGWPYNRILAALVASPMMTTQELSQLLVREFGTYYSMEGSYGGKDTLAALDLQALPELFIRLSSFSETLVANYHLNFSLERGFLYAKQDVERFKDKDYTDLLALLKQIDKWYELKDKISQEIHELVEYLQSGQSPIIANWHGSAHPNACGLSIYLPFLGCSPYYDKQDFASSGWNRVIKYVNRL